MRLIVTRYDQRPLLGKDGWWEFHLTGGPFSVSAQTACMAVHNAFPDTRPFRLTTCREGGHPYPVFTVCPSDVDSRAMEMVRLTDLDKLIVLGSDALEDVYFSGDDRRPLTIAEAGAASCQWVEDRAHAHEVDTSDLEVRWGAGKVAKTCPGRHLPLLNGLVIAGCLIAGLYYLGRALL